ncbi:prolyl 4-hydroxylase 1-like isoform X1 [Cucurbita pepo subsp. pepo]|uniref:prolyl 4-hydroxylase 1-like isoform X1 n=1 Tax=Cucurbita pepo subsp. pepo TaxID=3664 RepID=UPI000C9D4278|nr:prolyl 4-hydroxylase 1-like isoform X1 [Cucurbita pepo subsp. pepo]
MASGLMRIVFGLLTFVTVGMIIGALFQLAFIRRLEDSIGTEFLSAGRLHKTQYDGQRQFLQGLPNWINDKEAEILRLGYVKPEVVSWSPRIIVLHNFLSSERGRLTCRPPQLIIQPPQLGIVECDYLKAIALPRLEISTVVDTKTGKGIKSDFRTSSGMFLSHQERNYPMVQAIEKRISVYSQIPSENGELIQVLRYEKNQFYKPHHDYFSDTFNLKRGGQRIATMLMYLTDNVEGGETYFPKAGSGMCSCGGKTVPGLSVKPVKGDAVLFWSMGLDGQSDPNSIHGGCEVLGGEKWSATKWMRQKSTLIFKGHTPRGPQDGDAKVGRLVDGDQHLNAAKVSLGVLGIITQVITSPWSLLFLLLIRPSKSLFK